MSKKEDELKNIDDSIQAMKQLFDLMLSFEDESNSVVESKNSTTSARRR